MSTTTLDLGMAAGKFTFTAPNNCLASDDGSGIRVNGDVVD